MRSIIALATGAFLLSSAALAQPISAGHVDVLANIPSSSLTVTDWYKQGVYDESSNKIGEVSDVLIGPNGQVSALIIGVGGFLGVGQKDVAVNFSDVKQSKQGNKTVLSIDTTKDALKAAPGFKYDRETTSWVADTSNK